MPSDTIKMDVTLSKDRCEELVPNYDENRDRQALVDQVVSEMDLHSDTGGWIWTVRPMRNNNVRLQGRFIRAGESVLA